MQSFLCTCATVSGISYDRGILTHLCIECPNQMPAFFWVASRVKSCTYYLLFPCLKIELAFGDAKTSHSFYQRPRLYLRRGGLGIDSIQESCTMTKMALFIRSTRFDFDVTSQDSGSDMHALEWITQNRLFQRTAGEGMDGCQKYQSINIRGAQLVELRRHSAPIICVSITHAHTSRHGSHCALRFFSQIETIEHSDPNYQTKVIQPVMTRDGPGYTV